MAFEEALERAEAEGETLLRQARADFFDRGVATRAKRRHHCFMMRLDPIRTSVAAKPPGKSIALFALPLAPAADAGRTHAKTLGSLAMRRTRRDCAQNTNSKIHRQRSRHVCRPPSGRQSESRPDRFGNPSRFYQVGFRSSVFPLYSGSYPDDLKSLAHSCGSNSVMIWPTVFHKPSTVRSALARKTALSLANAFSMGLKSGL